MSSTEQEAGIEIETAIHSISMMYENENTDAILLFDASKAFNSSNRQSFLCNVSYSCYSIVIFVKLLQHSIKTFHSRRNKNYIKGKDYSR